MTKPWEIIDITFGKTDPCEFEMLTTLDTTERDKKRLIHELKLLNQQEQVDEQKAQLLKDQIAEKIAVYKEEKKKYIDL